MQKPHNQLVFNFIFVKYQCYLDDFKQKNNIPNTIKHYQNPKFV